jgi:hypothetical protein
VVVVRAYALAKSINMAQVALDDRARRILFGQGKDTARRRRSLYGSGRESR